MQISYSQAQEKFNEVIEHFKQSINAIRAGRANPSLVENILVDAYGQKMPIKQIANITVVDSSLLTVSPWDKGNLETTFKTIQFADIGINPILEGDLIKLPIPPLTEERRKEYIKVLKTKEEESRITVRQIRKEILLTLQEEKLPEDELKRKEEDLQKIVDKTNENLETITSEKEKELLTV